MTEIRSNDSSPATGVMRRQQSESRYALHRWQAGTPLVAFVEQYWWVRWDLTHTSPEPHLQKNVPDPCVVMTTGPDGLKRYGPMTKSFAYAMQGTGSIFGIKFTAGGFHALTGQDMANSVDVVFNLQERDPLSLTDLLTGSVDSERQVKLLIEEIEIHLRAAKRPEPQCVKQCLAVNQAVSLIKQHAGLYSVARLAELLATSERSLQRLFQRFTGMSPKQVIRQIRIQEVLLHWDTNKPGWQDIVDLLGYTDQAHFIRDFKRITGETPGKYLSSM